MERKPFEWLSGWWYTYPSEKMKVSWDYYSQYMPIYGKIQKQTTNQL
jgi:hypothetical protein